MGDEPVEILNPGGASPFLLTCDHASNALPAEYGRLGLHEEVFDDHIAYDIGAAEVTRGLSGTLDAAAILACFSRLLIDPNRSREQPGFIVQETDGIEVPGNFSLDEDEIARRMHLYYEPYHDAITQYLVARDRQDQAPAIVGLHSFTPIMQGAGRPWEVGILWNRDPRLAERLLSELRRDKHLTVGDNQPYSGRLLGHGMDAHGGARGLPHAVIEIRQDLIATPEGVSEWVERLTDVLHVIAGESELFQVRHY